jgi:uncharacterized protein with PIN domain
MSRQNLGALLALLHERPNALPADLAEWLRSGAHAALARETPLDIALAVRRRRGERTREFLEALKARNWWVADCRFVAQTGSAWAIAGEALRAVGQVERHRAVRRAGITLDSRPPPGLTGLQVHMFHAARFGSVSRPVPRSQKRLAEIIRHPH